MEVCNDIEISILKGDKLFNNNTPFIINLSTPQPDENDKKCNADLICVIDISGSMMGLKISKVKDSLKTLLSLMDEKDRLCLVLFNDKAKNFFDLQYLTKENKKILEDKINEIRSGGGTNILSGLKMAIDILKRQTSDEKNISSILLLSDGRDNFSNDLQLADSLKNLTKGFGLSFTLNTFGYGDDHDAKIMNKLANIRDGSFYYVEEYSKITEYFVSVLGSCVSVISKKLDLKLQSLSDYCYITKVFGEQNLYEHETNKNYFKTTLLQFICGKDYTFVLEIFVNESKVKIDEEILKLEISYEDIGQNNKKVQKELYYKYSLKDIDYLKANEEYIRAHVYYILEEAIKFKDGRQYKKGKELLENIENWLIKNYRRNNKEYLNDINNAKGLFSKDESIKLKSYNYTNCSVQNKMFKRIGNDMRNYNNIQKNLIKSIPIRTPNQYQINSNPIPLKQNYNSNQFPLNSNKGFQNLNCAPLNSRKPYQNNENNKKDKYLNNNIKNNEKYKLPLDNKRNRNIKINSNYNRSLRQNNNNDNEFNIKNNISVKIESNNNNLPPPKSIYNIYKNKYENKNEFLDNNKTK